VTVRLAWGAVTHPGTVRERNEDSLWARPPVFVVADGLGGRAGGEVASALAAQAFAPLENVWPLRDSAVLATVQTAHARIRARAAAQPELAGMGTTLAGLALTERSGGGHGVSVETLLLFHVGDSRVYRLRDGVLRLLTRDHTAVADLLRTGAIDGAEAEWHPQRHVLSRALGTRESVRPEARRLRPQPGDRYLLCTDGLSNELAPKVLTALLGSGSPEVAASRLLDEALTEGARDNVTVVVVDVLPEVDLAGLGVPASGA
jgi:PPM family protein phosphatase